MKRSSIVLIFCFFVSMTVRSQQVLTCYQAIDSAMSKNPDLVLARKYQAYQSAKVGTAFDLPATQVMQEFTRGVAVNVPWQSTVTQNGEWPGVYKNQKDIYQAEVKIAGWTLKDKEAYIQKAVLLAHLNYVTTVRLLSEIAHWDSMWAAGVQHATLRARLGESAVLESKSMLQQHRQWQTQVITWRADSVRYLNEWRQLCSAYSAIPSLGMFVWDELSNYPVEASLSHPYLQQWIGANLVAEQQVQLEKAKLFPSWTVGFQHYPATPVNTAFLGGKDAKAYVVMAGWSLPIFTSGQMARVKQARQGVQLVEATTIAEQSRWLSNYRIAFANYVSAKNKRLFYENTLLPEARSLLAISAEQYQLGNISYLEWLMLAQQNLQTVINYWQSLPQYNQEALELHYLNTNNK